MISNNEERLKIALKGGKIHSKIRNEKNDLLLMKRCNLYVGTGSGPDILAMNFQRPIVYVNWLRIPDLFTFQNNVVVIFKKIFEASITSKEIL